VDIFSTVDLKAMYQKHLNSNVLATLLVSRRPTARQLLFNQKEQLCGWRNREKREIKSFLPNFDPSEHEEYAFGGIHVISPDIFHLMDAWNDKFSIIDFYLSACTQKNIRLYTEEKIRIIDAGKTNELAEAAKMIKESYYASN
jgi:NDP-sugar pyrophosphorylase family protein